MFLSILLATHNGGKYLKEQLDSILRQTNTSWHLYIHDDDSTDSTVSIIKEYAQRYPDNIKYLDDNVSFGNASENFNYLLNHTDADYIMFCDQDDVWLPNKIELTLAKMTEAEKKYGELPILVHSDLKVVDNDLNIIADSFMQYQNLDASKDRLSDILIQNHITGCTVMINRKLAELALPIPKQAIMHDWWLGLVAAAFGKICYIDQSTMLYRQHLNNDTGAKKFLSVQTFQKALSLISSDELYTSHLKRNIKQAASFLARYRNVLTSNDIEMLEEFVNIEKQSFFKRRKTLLKYKLVKHGLLRNIGLFLKI